MNEAFSVTTVSDQPVVLNSPNLIQKILDATRESVIIVNGDLRIATWNAPAEIAFARQEMSLAGRRLSEVIRDLDVHAAFKTAITTGIAADVRLETTGSDRRKFDVHIAPIEFDGVRHAIGFFYDTTQIERLESIRQEFLSNISHELRTPLTSILAFVETLENGALDEAENSRRFLGVIRRNAERMHRLIADILELSLIESGKVSIEKRPAKLFDMANEVFTNLSAKARDHEIDLINEVPPETQILADSVRLEQMLLNLVDNAIKFNRRGGSVKISAERNGQTDQISVSDTGEGILPEHLTRLFERFYRVDRARSNAIGGTGLGLAIVKHLARLHGGEVSVRSTLSEGTIFRIDLPVR